MSPPALTLFAAQECVLRTCPRTGRLLVSWSGMDALHQREMLADWRRTFLGAPRLACWRRRQGCWSLRPGARARVLEWLEAWGIQMREEEGSRS